MTPPAPTKKLHLLFVLENYFPNIGGVEILFKTLAEQVAAQGHRITIITTRLSSGHPCDEQIDNLRILRYRFANRYLFTLLATYPVWRHAKHCDLVHTTSYNAALPAFLGAWLRQKKAIVTFHEVWDGLWFQLPHMSWLGCRLHWLFEQMLLRLPFQRFVGVSQTTAQALRTAGVALERVVAIPNGIDYQDFAEQKTNPATNFAEQKNTDESLRQNPFTYTYFGRLGVSKGLDILLEASHFFQKKHPDSQLQLIVPTEPAGMFRWLTGRIRELGLQTHVQLRHHLPFAELKQALLASDCVVIPSLSEGFCFAAVESMALGVPIVHSGRSALAEVVGGRHLAMREHSAPALAEALERARAGEWTELPLQKFELEKTVEAYLRLYFEAQTQGANSNSKTPD